MSKVRTTLYDQISPNKIYLKEKPFGFKMDPSKGLEENLDDFNKITIDFANIDEKISDENQAIILLNSLPDFFKEVMAAIKYGKDNLLLDDVLGALRSRDLEIKFEKRDSNNGENLMARGRLDKKDGRNYRGKSKSKSRLKGKLKCFLCHKEGILKEIVKRGEKTRKTNKMQVRFQ